MRCYRRIYAQNDILINQKIENSIIKSFNINYKLLVNIFR